MKSWMLSWFTIQNSATFVSNTCLTCQRFFNEALRATGRPICILNTYDWARCYQEYMEGHPPEYDLPEWDPLKCGVKIEK